MTSDQQTLRDLLTAQAHRYEKKIFLESGERRFSFATVDDRTDRVATGLSRLGLRAGDRIALLLPNTPEFIFFLLGAPKLGMIPVPLDPSAPQEEVLSVLWHCGATAIVTEKRFEGLRLTSPQVRHWILVDDASFAGQPFNGLSRGPVLGFWPDLDPDDPALIVYQTGPSRNRKAIVLTHRNLLSNCSQILQPFRMDETDRFLCAVPLTTAAAQVLLVLAPLAAGGACILGESLSVEIPRTIEDNCITVLAGSPDLYRSIASSPDFAHSELSSLRLAVCSSGPVGEDVFCAFEDRHDALIVEGYGPPEATCLTCANPYTGVIKRGSIGLALPGLECRIVGEKGAELPPGVPGEIIVRGPNVMKEYYRDPDGTAKTLRDGWLHTGDRGTIDVDGYYHLSD